VASSVYKSIGVTLNGTSVIPVAGVYTVNLIVGTNTLTITVTAEDGTTTMTYNVTITRQDHPPVPADDPVTGTKLWYY
jgi:hypothetical protein